MDTADESAVLTAMADAGLTVEWEHPGMAVIEITRDLTVATGLHGWEYGSVSRLVDDCWEPVEDMPAEPEGLTEHDTDPTLIAASWRAWITTHAEYVPTTEGA